MTNTIFSAPCRRHLLASALLLFISFIFLPGPARAQREGTLGLDTTLEKVNDPALKAKIERAEKQVAGDAGNYRLHFQLGNYYYDAGILESAKTSFEKAVELNPKYIEALVNLGSVLSDMGDEEGAITNYESALGLDPEDCKARSNLGNAYYSLSRFPDAIYEYRRAIEIDPKCYSALYNMGVAFADVGMFREAVSWWERVVAAAPNTDAAANARENIKLLERFTGSPIPKN